MEKSRSRGRPNERIDMNPRRPENNNNNFSSTNNFSANTPVVEQIFNQRMRSPDYQHNHQNNRKSSVNRRSQSANRYNNEFLVHNGYDLPAQGKTGKFKQKLAITKRTDVQPDRVEKVSNLWTKPNKNSTGQVPQSYQISQNAQISNSYQINKNQQNHQHLPNYQNYQNHQVKNLQSSKTHQNNTPKLTSNLQNTPSKLSNSQQYMRYTQRYPIEIKSHIFIQFKKSELLTWCDACTGLIWPMLGSTCAKCKNCSITVHHRCLELLNTSQLPICPNRPVKLKPKTPVLAKKEMATDNLVSSNLDSKKPVIVQKLNPTSSNQKTPPNKPSLNPSLIPSPEINLPRLSWSSQPKIKNTSTIRKLFPTPKELHNAITQYNQLRIATAPPRNTKNNSKNSNLKMSLHEDQTTFRGYIRVNIEIQRPVKILQSSKSHTPNKNITTIKRSKSQNRKQQNTPGNNSNSSSLSPDSTDSFSSLKKLDQFSKNLHLTSQTTAYDVIEALLKRYKIADHIKKFALYQRIQKTATHHIIERLEYTCKPLVLRLYHGRSSTVVQKESSKVVQSSGVSSSYMNEPHQFLLKEADVDGIQWDQFNINELVSFMTIIDIEERKTRNEVMVVFKRFRQSLVEVRDSK